ncbi:MAG: sulfatase [Acidobacteria bacterium]|nr:sulfatase [Acidobacteriota bacterium]
MLTRRTLLASLKAAGFAPAQTRKPNLIVFLADDLGYGDIGCYGSPDVPTPNLDALAKAGVRFTDAYVSCAVCSPSRVALLTGQYQHRHGHEFNSGSPEREAEVNFGVPRSATLLPAHLKSAGYTSGIFGKWHLGVRPGYHPLERGFDEFYGFLVGGNSYVTKRTPGGSTVDAGEGPSAAPEDRAQPIYRGHEKIREDRYFTDALGEEAAAFVERNQNRPFFLYLPFNAIHTPLHATNKYLDRFAHIKNVRHRYLAAMTVSMDEAIGRVLKKVKDAGLERDTMVVFLSDNGCPTITGAGSNGPLNGQKVTYYEGGIRVPMIMRWEGRLPAGSVYRNPVVSRDVAPTFLAAAGVRVQTQFDGVDLAPFVTGANKGIPHDALFWRGGKARAVRKGSWKLIEFGESYTRLYDLSKDLGEKNDLAAKLPDKVRELRAAWQAWSAQMKPAAWPPRYRELVVNGEKLTWEL